MKKSLGKNCERPEAVHHLVVQVWFRQAATPRLPPTWRKLKEEATRQDPHAEVYLNFQTLGIESKC